MPIDHLILQLDFAANFSLDTYFYLIFQLTTALRPSEVARFFKYGKEAYVTDAGKLNYNCTQIEHEGDPPPALIQKVRGKVRYDKLMNPAISIVAMYIINNQEPDLYRVESNQGNVSQGYFHHTYSEGPRANVQELKKYCERSIRTTAGTHIAYLDKCLDPLYRATLRTVQERMAHLTIVTASEVYAQTSPDDARVPEVYFNFRGGIFMNGTQVDVGQNLWDSFLLRHVCKTLKGKLTPAEYKTFKKRILKETKDYTRNHNPPTKEKIDSIPGDEDF